MNWTIIWQVSSVLLNFAGMSLNLYLTKKTRNQYHELSRKTLEQLNEQHDNFQFHIDRLVEEIDLLKTNEGLYDVRNNEEQYQIYLSLLRKK